MTTSTPPSTPAEFPEHLGVLRDAVAKAVQLLDSRRDIQADYTYDQLIALLGPEGEQPEQVIEALVDLRLLTKEIGAPGSTGDSIDQAANQGARGKEHEIRNENASATRYSVPSIESTVSAYAGLIRGLLEQGAVEVRDLGEMAATGDYFRDAAPRAGRESSALPYQERLSELKLTYGVWTGNTREQLSEGFRRALQEEAANFRPARDEHAVVAEAPQPSTVESASILSVLGMLRSATDYVASRVREYPEARPLVFIGLAAMIFTAVAFAFGFVGGGLQQAVFYVVLILVVCVIVWEIIRNNNKYVRAALSFAAVILILAVVGSFVLNLFRGSPVVTPPNRGGTISPPPEPEIHTVQATLMPVGGTSGAGGARRYTLRPAIQRARGEEQYDGIHIGFDLATLGTWTEEPTILQKAESTDSADPDKKKAGWLIRIGSGAPPPITMTVDCIPATGQGSLDNARLTVEYYFTKL